ncbi:hypothetical protein E3T28_01960 [Cryobacterium sinapicolor]|uniref:Transcriptional regulator, AbiEi antitoxin, Type IV TA system n=1 Tax=Cryobacterium sinapicolor TaxID=1259236 RepID=A0ABY2JIL2_9MICO|nr:MULTISPECIES: hypothetical protein [Cryobacterium]TFC87985.1 hypothetical protein E3O67_08670 [Cryobacterium sp. TMT3-29-2]TFD04756.1 hypothetical protein E3T28_01960 [Cryobacterium sinapicolor]
MPDSPDEHFSPNGLLLSSDLRRAFGADLRLRRLAGRGELHRLARGQYIDATLWAALNSDQRYALRVRGAAETRQTELVLSHQSAAVLWALPTLFGWPLEVHFLTERTRGGRSTPGIRKHATGLDPTDVTTVNGLLVTTIERTVIDLAATLDLKSAVAIADRAIAVDRTGRFRPLTTRVRLLETWERMLPFRGSVRARAVIDFASTLSGSPNESGSRVNVALNGFPEPVLQHPFVVDGKTVFTDFYWIAEHSVGEADGKRKYFDPVMLDGRTTAQVVYDEKRREDGVRRQVHAFTRWDFPVGMSQSRLRSRLLQLGLPTGRPRLQFR